MPLVFSYGSLQHEDVQVATFERPLRGQPDELVGFERCDTPQHANVTFNGRNDSRVSGTVFEITDAELARADRYEERDAYTRIATVLAARDSARYSILASEWPAVKARLTGLLERG